MKLTLEQKCDRRSKANHTAQRRLGPKVRSVEELAELAANKRSVYYYNCCGLLPAIVMMNMNASQVHGAIKAGMIFRYRPAAASANRRAA